MADTLSVANRFLDLAEANNDTLTPMQLLKLVYIAHGWMLGLYGRPLIADEVQAWQYGPVIPKLYNRVRRFRSNPVEGPIPGADGELGADEDSIIGQVYRLYGGYSGPALSRLTHASGTPWHQTYIPGEYGTPISNDLIEDHYARLAKEVA